MIKILEKNPVKGGTPIILRIRIKVKKIWLKRCEDINMSEKIRELKFWVINEINIAILNL